MRSGELHDLWKAADDAGRIEMFQRLHGSTLALTADQFGAELCEFDGAASAAGLALVWVTVVDAAGMRDKEEGASCPRDAARHRPRALSPLA